jgi:hypothetical protein
MVAMGGFHATPQAEITPRKGTPIHYKPEPWRRVINPQPVQKLGTIGQLSTGFVGKVAKDRNADDSSTAYARCISL